MCELSGECTCACVSRLMWLSAVLFCCLGGGASVFRRQQTPSLQVAIPEVIFSISEYLRVFVSKSSFE